MTQTLTNLDWLENIKNDLNKECYEAIYNLVVLARCQANVGERLKIEKLRKLNPSEIQNIWGDVAKKQKDLKMIVYLVTLSYPYEGDVVCGIYADEQKAMEAMDKLKAEYKRHADVQKRTYDTNTGEEL